MTAVFKNRLIGSAILIIAAVVFLPDLLDGQKQVVKDDFKAIPERPEFASVAQQQVFAQDQHDASRAQAMALPEDNSPVLDGTDPDPTPTDPVPTEVSTTAAEVLPEQNYASVSTDSAAAKPVAELPAADQNQPKTAATQPVLNEPAVVSTEKAMEPVVKPGAVVEKKPANKALSQSAWVVKVGSFSKEPNANALVTKLRQAGFATFSRKIVNSQGQTMVSVLVGPDLKKEKLEQSLPELQQLAANQQLKVTAFSPVENN